MTDEELSGYVDMISQWETGPRLARNHQWEVERELEDDLNAPRDAAARTAAGGGA